MCGGVPAWPRTPGPGTDFTSNKQKWYIDASYHFTVMPCHNLTLATSKTTYQWTNQHFQILQNTNSPCIGHPYFIHSHTHIHTAVLFLIPTYSVCYRFIRTLYTMFYAYTHTPNNHPRPPSILSTVLGCHYEKSKLLYRVRYKGTLNWDLERSGVRSRL